MLATLPNGKQCGSVCGVRRYHWDVSRQCKCLASKLAGSNLAVTPRLTLVTRICGNIIFAQSSLMIGHLALCCTYGSFNETGPQVWLGGCFVELFAKRTPRDPFQTVSALQR